MRSSTKNKPFIPKLSDVWYKIVVNKKGESIKRHYYKSPNAGILQISKKALEEAGIDLNKIKEKTEDKTKNINKSRSGTRSGTRVRSGVRSGTRSRVRSKSSSNSSPITRIRRSQTTSRKSPNKVLKIRVKRLESKTPIKIGSRYKDIEKKKVTRTLESSSNKKIILTLKEKDKIADEIKEGIEVAKEGVNEMIQKAQMRSKSPKITRVTSKDKEKIIKAISESNNPEKQIDNIAKNISKGLKPISKDKFKSSNESNSKSKTESEYDFDSNIRSISRTISKNKSFKLKDQKVKTPIKVKRSKIKSKSSNMVRTTNKRSSVAKSRNFRSTSRIDRLIRETKRSKK